MTPEVGRILASLTPGEPAEILFEKGVYHFFKEGAAVSERLVNAVRPGRKSYAFLLDGLSDIVIDGNGSEFVFHERMFPVGMFHCRNIVLRNFTVDFTFSRYAQGRVTASDEHGFALEIDPALFPVEVDAQGCLNFLAGGERFSTAPGCDKVLLVNGIFGKKPWDYLFVGPHSPEDCADLPVKYFETDAVKTPDGVRFTFRPGSFTRCFEPGETLIFSYEPRDNADIMAQSCRDVTLEHVALYRGGGMGVVVSDTENFTAADTVIQVRPGRGECRSTTADGFYFTQCRGLVALRNCLISQTLDDALNLHGIYTLVSEIVAPDTVKLFLAGTDNHHGFAPCRPGDMLEFSSADTHCRKTSRRVLECVEEDALHYRVKLDRAASVAELDVVENETAAADFELVDCRIDRCPHCRISDNGKIRVSGNVFEKIHGIRILDLFSFWYESGAVTDLILDNNQFTDSPCPGADPSPVIAVRSRRKPGNDVPHRNVTIRNNTFTNCGSGDPLMILADTDGLTVTGNRSDGGRMAKITNCTQVATDFPLES